MVLFFRVALKADQMEANQLEEVPLEDKVGMKKNALDDKANEALLAESASLSFFTRIIPSACLGEPIHKKLCQLASN